MSSTNGKLEALAPLLHILELLDRVPHGLLPELTAIELVQHAQADQRQMGLEMIDALGFAGDQRG